MHCTILLLFFPYDCSSLFLLTILPQCAGSSPSLLLLKVIYESFFNVDYVLTGGQDVLYINVSGLRMRNQTLRRAAVYDPSPRLSAMTLPHD